jgi:hypothetical protein
LNKSSSDNNQHWINYERAAKQHDEEFWERQNGKLDALLIFVSQCPVIGGKAYVPR